MTENLQEILKGISEFVVAPAIISLYAYIRSRGNTKKHEKTVSEIQAEYELKIREIERNCQAGECRGNTEYCVARIIRKCMQEYLRIEAIIKAAAGESYIRDLVSAEKNGLISFIQGERQFVIQRHKKILDSAFMNGRIYMHDLIVEDDFPVTYIKQNGVDIINPALVDLTNDVLDNYYTAVWDTYEYACESSIYKLDFHARRTEYDKNKPFHRTTLLELMIKFNKLMGKER